MKASLSAIFAFAAWTLGCGSTSYPGTETPTESDTGTGTATRTEAETVRFVVHNDSDHDVFLVRDTEFMPLWLEIDGVKLNGYGQSWCGDDTGTHSEPFFSLVRVPANDTLDWDRPWAPRAISGEGSCWSAQPLSSGKRSARACLYDTDVAPLNTVVPHKFNSTAPVSTWFTDAPSRCVDVDVDVAAAGATIDVHL